jgi:hypothetical protein
MAKRIPVDCRRLTEAHLRDLDDDQLGVLVQRIEVQTQALNRALRLVASVMDARRSG